MNQTVDETTVDLDAASEADTVKKSSNKRLMMFAGGFFVLLLGATYLSFNNVREPDPSSIARPPNLDTTPGGTVQEGSELYRESLAAANDQNADAAERQGTSFMATPEAVPENIDQSEGRLGDSSANPQAIPLSEREQVITPASISVSRVPTVQREPEQEVQPQPARVRVPIEQDRSSRVVTSNQTTAPSQPEQENPFAQLITQEAERMAAINMPRESLVEAFDGVSGDNQGDVSAFADEETLREYEERQNDGEGTSDEDQRDADQVYIRAGDIVYAEMINSVSSDAMMSVVAEVTVGDYRGSRVIGTFAVDDVYGGLVVEFNQMVLEDGSSLAITALAVDGRSAEASISTDVDRRYLQRYGGVLASAFIGGYAETAAQRGEEQTVTGDNVVVTSDDATAEQASYAGLAAAAEAISGDIEANRPKTPRINLRRGHPLALLFMASTNEDIPDDVQN